MSSWQARFFSALLRQTFKRKLAAATDAFAARKVLNSGIVRTPGDVVVTPATVGGVPGEWVASMHGSGSLTMLFLHGGGYFACSPRSHRAFTSFFARQGMRVYAPDYRLAPEHPFPAAADDALAVYEGLLGSGADPARILISGDSAGGGLTLSLLLRIRARGLAMPAAVALFSPLTDLAGTGASLVENDARCAMFRGARIAEAGQFYLAGTDPRDPVASPLYADLRGLPPMLIHVGADEVLRDDSTRLAERARTAGVEVALRIWSDVCHDWQLFHTFIPEGRASLFEACAFLKQRALFDRPGASAPRAPDYDVLIVGGGFSGLGMAIKLKQTGNGNVIVLEKAPEIGGTWRENTYPGCACDVPSHMYSFSFERKWNWSRMYATQPEIRDYLRHCVRKYELAPFIRCSTALAEAVFDETRDLWTVRTADGGTVTARAVVAATGALHRPAYPKLPGIERFHGTVFHSAEWRHDHDLRGRRVAVIGTGASAIQFVPQVAKQAAQVTLFQRTPAWVLPKMDRALGPKEQWVYRHVPGAMRLFRNFLYWRQELLGLAFLHPRLMAHAKRMAEAHMRAQIPDADLRSKLTPDYTIGCKRVLIANDYFPVFSQAHVALVTSGVAEVREASIVACDGTEYPADTLIYGTGFRVGASLAPIRILGRNGVDLNDTWRDGAQAHLGLTVAGYPNLFLLLGPNTGLGHNSVVFMAEQQIRHVLRCLKAMRRRAMTSIEPRAEAQAQFNARVQSRLGTTVWASGCRSWYLDAQGRNVAIWPGFTFQYWRLMRRTHEAEYRFGRVKTAAGEPARKEEAAA
ncbi:FAD-dependent oxidoreductase [Oxalobacteraceae bacterium OM1]|nr:FAD-dependent oxidoreductase [Oxalobacteraceae bacterium OM1]